MTQSRAVKYGRVEKEKFESVDQNEHEQRNVCDVVWCERMWYEE